MPSQSDIAVLEKRDLADYGFARVRDSAFDAVSDLWRRRKAEGMKKKDIAEALSRDAGWVTRSLSGPGNWTLRTFGELVSALGGEAEIKIHANEDAVLPAANYHAYAEYETPKYERANSATAPGTFSKQDAVKAVLTTATS